MFVTSRSDGSLARHVATLLDLSASTKELDNVSLSRDGTRSTARLFQVSRPSLDRHKRHIEQTDEPADQVPQVTTGGDGSSSLRSRLETLMGNCENALNQAQASKNLPASMRARQNSFTRNRRQHKVRNEWSFLVQAGRGKETGKTHFFPNSFPSLKHSLQCLPSVRERRAELSKTSQRKR
jgi:hypothetical protein